MDQSSPNFTPLSVATARAGHNYAPSKPLFDVIQNRTIDKAGSKSKLDQSIREIYTALLNDQKQAWNEIQSMAQLVALFRQGNQLLQRRPFGAPGFYVRPLRDDDSTQMRQTAMNLMGFFSQACESKVIASNPNVNMRPGDDTPEAIAAAQACRPVVDYFETEWYTAKFSRREAIRFLTDGMVIHQVRWNPFLGGYSINEREVSEEEVTIDEGGGICLDCNHEADAESFAGQYSEQCPECNSPAVEVRQPIKNKLSRIGMGQSRPIGEPELISSSLMAWRWDLTRDLECSPWAIKRQYITQGAVKLMLGDVTIPDSQSSEDYGLEVLRALAYAGQAFQGSSQAANYRSASLIDKRPVLSEFWLTPEYQAMIETEGGETLCGVELPKGRLSDFFKGESICLVGLNDFALTIGMYAKESQQDEVITAQWFMNAESGVGRGMEDTAAVQRRFNAVDGQIYQGLATTATPAVVTDMSLLKEDQGRYLFTPGYNVDISLALLPPNMKLQDAFFVGAPGTVSQQYVQYGSQFLREMAQISSLVTEFTNGLIGVDNRTATGAQITAQLANSLYGPMLASKGQMRVEIAKRIVCLISAHDVSGRHYPGKGAAKGRMVNGRDLKGKVVFDLVPNSELPVTPFSRQTDVRVFFESYGGAVGAAQLQQQFPAFFKATAAPFNIPFDDETEDEVSNLCLARLEQMKGNLAAGVDDPAMLVEMLMPPISQIEPKQKEKADWWARWMDLESAQRAPLELRAAAEAAYWCHQNMMTQRGIPEAMNQGLVAAAGAAPMAMGQAMMQPEQVQQQPPDDSAKIEADLAMDSAKHETDLALKQMEQQTQLAVVDKQTETQKEVAKISGENQIKAAKLRPKPAPARKAS